MDRITRRALIASAVAGAGGIGLLEYHSLTGQFDHSRLPRSMTAAARLRYAASLVEVDHGAGGNGIVHVGHSTHLLCVAGVRMLTDPWFADPAFGAMAHIAGPATTPDAIGQLDAVLVSHDHADHFDRAAVDRLDKRAMVIVATEGLRNVVGELGFASTCVLAPWESIDVRGARVTAVPAVHDVYEVGFVVQGSGQSVYFAGDTRLHDDLPAIAERLAPTMAILPVDGTRINGESLQVMTPGDAVQAARTLKVRRVMPSHAEAEFSDPLVKYAIASTITGAPAIFVEAMRRALPDVRCHVPAPGELVRLA